MQHICELSWFAPRSPEGACRSARPDGQGLDAPHQCRGKGGEEQNGWWPRSRAGSVSIIASKRRVCKSS